MQVSIAAPQSIAPLRYLAPTPTLDWIGKQAVLNYHEQFPYRPLVRLPDGSKGEQDSGYLLIEGDNLEALR